MIRKLCTILIICGATGSFQISGTVQHVPVQRPCIGYTIIEFGKGIGCKGDTIRLTRKNGLQVLLVANNDINPCER